MPGVDRTEGDVPDIVATYHRLLNEDEELTMPVAAIEALIEILSTTPASTVSETLHLVSKLTDDLKKHLPNPISASAGTDLFNQYLEYNLQGPNATADFEIIRMHLVQNGKLFVERAKAARDTIAGFGRRFVREGNVILTNGGSRVVGSLLKNAAESGNNQGSIRFKVIYVVSPEKSAEEGEATANIAALRERDIPVATIPATAVAYCMSQVTQCFVGAEGVMENGGVVSRMGTYQMGMLAKAKNKPFYIVSESHKFVRMFPLHQQDLGIDQDVVDYKTSKGSIKYEDHSREITEGDSKTPPPQAVNPSLRAPSEAVDLTPPELISAIITEKGVLLPSAVSEELIKIWF